MKALKFSIVAVAFALMVGMFGGSTPALAERGDSFNGHQTYGNDRAYGRNQGYGHYRNQRRNRQYYGNNYGYNRSYRRRSNRSFYFNFGGQGFGFRFGH